DHRIENEVTPCQRIFAKTLAAITLGRLGQDREERHFVQREVTNILVKIGAAGCLNAKAAAAERNLVEIKLHDLALGQRRFDAAGEKHFLELAGDGIFVAQQDVLGDL